MSSSNSYQQGRIDGIKLWGEACAKEGSCERCPIGIIRGTGITCQEFARKYPAKMISLLQEMNNNRISFYEEFCIRFPNSNITVEELADCACRKVVFEGYLSCKGGDCVECWQEDFTGDITITNTDIENKIQDDESITIKYCSNCGKALDSNAAFCGKCGSPQ